MIFVIKKILTLALMPLSIGLSAVWFGVICWWLHRGLNSAKVLVSCGVLMLTVLSFSGAANRIVNQLEMLYPPVVDTAALRHVKWVIVLGGGQALEEGIPANLQLGGSTLARLVEGIRIHRELEGSTIVLSGGAVFDRVPVAETMAAAARLFGVDSDRMLLESESRDTGEQAERIRSIVNEDALVLVTSAIHMPRSMQLFEQNGMKPIPAPSEYESRTATAVSPSQFFPRACELAKVEAALHEYMGLMWSAVKRSL